MTALALSELCTPYPYVISQHAVRDANRLVESLPGLETTSCLSLRSAEELRQHSILELQGLGKEIWAGVDALEYINELRDGWEDR